MEDQKLADLYKDVINIDKQKLVSYLQCPLCKGIFRCPMTINECMHTFCKVCIYRHFYSNVNVDSCPSCNTKLGGKPLDTLIFDNSIASLVEIIFPEFDEIDKEACVRILKIYCFNSY
jgi:E3 ubiquitin-protein ligase DRIP